MSALVQAARKYINVPFRHRGRSERYLDCAGLAWIAHRDCGVVLPDFRLYSSEPSAHGPGLTHYMEAALGKAIKVTPVRKEDLQAGDVVVMRFAKEPHHVGIVGDYKFGGPSLIHADGHTGRVIETRLPEDTIKRITHVFRRPI